MIKYAAVPETLRSSSCPQAHDLKPRPKLRSPPLSPSPSPLIMDFFKAKQPIALPIDSADENLLKSGEEFDPELAANVPQQQEPAKRCCRFKKGTRGRKVIRRLGHFVVLGAFFYWLWGPTVKFNRAGHELHDFQYSDFTDLDEVPNVVPDDFLWVRFCFVDRN